MAEQTFWSRYYVLMMGLGKTSFLPNMKSLASTVEDGKFWGASLYLATYTFSFNCVLVKVLGKPKLFAKLKVATFCHYRNIREIPLKILNKSKIGNSPFFRETGQISILQNLHRQSIIMKFVTNRYLGDAYSCAKFGANTKSFCANV